MKALFASLSSMWSHFSWNLEKKIEREKCSWMFEVECSFPNLACFFLKSWWCDSFFFFVYFKGTTVAFIKLVLEVVNNSSQSFALYKGTVTSTKSHLSPRPLSKALTNEFLRKNTKSTLRLRFNWTNYLEQTILVARQISAQIFDVNHFSLFNGTLNLAIGHTCMI